MHVLITGHLGYIGPVMIHTFKEAGHFVTGLDTGYFRECVDPVESPIAPDREIFRDIRNVQAKDLEDVDAVMHLAALSNDPLGQLDQELTLQINFQATAAVARLAKERGVGRFVFASSCSLYGAADGADAPLAEGSPFNPVSAYAISKVRTEEALRLLADENFSPVFLRNATAFGASPRMRFDLVLNNLMGWARTTGTVRVLSDGKPWRPLVHIEDIALAALCAVQAPREAVHNKAFNIGREDCNFRIHEIAEATARQVRGAEIVITGETAGDLRSYRVDFTKALTGLPGFAPSWTLAKGCAELDQWFDRHPKISSETIGDRHYVRLKQLCYLIERRDIDERLFWRELAGIEELGR